MGYILLAMSYVLLTIATTVVDDTVVNYVTAFNGFIISQEHDVILVLIYCETTKVMFQNNRSVGLSI